MNKIGFLISSLLVVLALLSSTLFVVDQRQYAVVYTLAEIKEVITEPGLNFKLPPPFQSVTFLDRRTLTLDSPETRAIQTAEKKNLVIDWLVKWRITDPKQFIRNTNGTDLRVAEARLGPLVQASLNEEVTRRTVKDVLSTEREKIMQGVKARLTEAKEGGVDVAEPGEISVLEQFLKLSDQEYAASTALKAAQESLMEKVFQQYAKLTEDEIKTLVVDDKWLTSINQTVQGELDRVSQTLTGRIRQLAERYAARLPQITIEVATLASRVEQHLEKMGLNP